MKKTVSINLNSFVFVIDEDAYAMLHLYLSKLEVHFSKIEEGGEIVKDIETRISEIFNQKINDSKHVINIRDVEEVIAILGNVEDITGDDNDESKVEDEKGEKKSKKLFRDPDTKVLAGVCSGLAEYTGISVIFWRILFMVLLFAGQVGIIAYIILWIAVPEARTTAQKIEMKGGKITLSSIEKTVKQEFDDVKKNFRKINSNKFSDFFTNIGNAFMSIITLLAKVFGKAVGVLFLLIGASTITVLTIGLISVGKEDIIYTNDFISMIWLPGLLQYITNSGTAWFLSICLLIVCVIPLIAIISWGVQLLFNVKTNKYLGYGTFAIWVVAIILTVVASLNIGASFRSVDTKIAKEVILTDSTKTYRFSISPEYTDFELQREEDIEDVNDLNIFINSHILTDDGKKMQSFPDINFYPSDDTVATMEIKYIARGANRSEVKENIQSIKYTYQNDTSLVYLDPYLQINSKRWRAQEVKVSIYLPIGTKAIIDKSLAPLIDIEDATGEERDEDMTGKEILVTSKGFVIL